MKNPTFFFTLVLTVLFLVLVPGCKKSGDDGLTSADFYSAWEFQVRFSDESGLNLPEFWYFSFDTNGDFSLFNQKEGSFIFVDDAFEFTMNYTDPFQKFGEHLLTFKGTFNRDGGTPITGTVTERGMEVAGFQGEKIPTIVTYDVAGDWKFTISMTPDWSYELQSPMEFRFDPNGDYYLSNEIKKTYDFDGRTIRFPFWQILDNGYSTVHVLFMGYMSSDGRMMGSVFNDVSQNYIIATFEAERTGSF